MTALPIVGRFLYAIPFVIFALFHFMNGSAMAGIVPVPGGVFWVYLVGVAHLAAALSIMTGKLAVLATRLLALLLLIFVFTIHLPGVIHAADQAAMQLPMLMLLKDTALAGGALVLSGVFAESEGKAEG